MSSAHQRPHRQSHLPRRAVSHRGPREPNRTGRRRVQRAVRRRRRVARSSCAPPLRPRRIRGDGDAVLDLPPPAGAVRGTVLPAHHAGARQRVPRADGDGRRGQDRVLDRERGLLPRDERRGDLGQPGLVGRPHHRRVSGQRRVRAALPRRRRRDVRGAPTLRLRLRRQRRRVPHDRRGREHHRRVGRVRSVRHRVADGHPERVLRAHARPADPAPPSRPDRRRRRARRQWRHVRGAGPRGARRPRRSDPDGLPAALVVRPPHDGDARLPGALPRHDHGRPVVLRGRSGPSRATSATTRPHSNERSCTTGARSRR